MGNDTGYITGRGGMDERTYNRDTKDHRNREEDSKDVVGRTEDVASKGGTRG